MAPQPRHQSTHRRRHPGGGPCAACRDREQLQPHRGATDGEREHDTHVECERGSHHTVRDANPCSFLEPSVVTANDLKQEYANTDTASRNCWWTTKPLDQDPRQAGPQ